jgi:hypothetical protein
MNGAIPLFLLYAFMAWTGKALPLPFYYTLEIFQGLVQPAWSVCCAGRPCYR